MIICIVGPTGVGKSALAIEVAKTVHGEIINGDAFQIYKDMNIGTAKPSEMEMKSVPHHLFSFVNPDQDYSAFNYQVDARNKIAELSKRNVPIIIVGGTGMYLKAALFDFDLELQEQKVDMSEYECLNNEELYEKLSKIDPIEASKIHMNNRKRVLRAIEIYLMRGEKKSALIERQHHQPIYDVCFVGLEVERQKLYQDIDRRVDNMIEKGLEKEVQMLVAKYGSNHKAFQAIGYKDFIIGNENNESTALIVEHIKHKSHAYARRQYTYFKNQFIVNWFSSKKEAYDFCINKLNHD